MTTTANRWAKDERKRLLYKYGGRCLLCGSTEALQFAHRKPTPLSGQFGRGRKERLIDIRRHPDSYVLLCGKKDGSVKASCHYWYDHLSG